jgi:hypothetical protein
LLQHLQRHLIHSELQLQTLEGDTLTLSLYLRATYFNPSVYYEVDILAYLHQTTNIASNIEPITTTSTYKVEVILNDQTEWLQFIQIVRQIAEDTNIWNYINPDINIPLPLLVMPIMPLASNITEDSTLNVADLDKEQREIFKLINAEYYNKNGA